jgi:tripartite-type tricarboxylate transporter receptor subunit TctC
MGIAGKMMSLVAGAFVLAGISAAQAQTYPTKPIRIILGYGAGGIADITSRLIAQKLTASMGQQVIVDNKPGAGQVVAVQLAAAAEPDGYTLLQMNNGQTISAALFKQPAYDLVKDLQPVTLIGAFGVLVLVDKTSPYNSLKDLIAAAKANPDKLNFGGIGLSTQQFAAELFKSSLQLPVTVVPFKTTPSLMQAVSGQDVQVAFEMAAPVLENVRAGQYKALATSSDKRFAGLPDVPTAVEAGVPSYQVTAWNAIGVPAKTPRAIVDRLNKEIRAALADPDIQKRFLEFGVEARGSTPEEAKQTVVSELGKWADVIKSAKIELQ